MTIKKSAYKRTYKICEVLANFRIDGERATMVSGYEIGNFDQLLYISDVETFQ